MSLEECYAALEGDYNGVTARLGGERLVKKFIIKFLNDSSFSDLEKYLSLDKYDEAFRAAHTVKGVCQNLGLTKLYQSSSALTEALRSGNYEIAESLMGKTKTDYAQTVSAIETFRAANEL